MSKLEQDRQLSPCVNVCFLNDDDVCVGCYRTGMEIATWGRMTGQEQREVLELVKEREQASAFVAN
ncbi:DUF1289 domain-containing protein [Marinomonas mediterranea]|uniref:DUF1289 domain-containing protein n=1 Tax=Marinomonas mediterranea TaxID=119864 RepID=UPI002349C863|nr:DUF1289 domain-containing protein [Marinomonas mediterranea]WCN08771.1 DUF1289 domain-containing protein [Marinomonas mediterranea]